MKIQDQWPKIKEIVGAALDRPRLERTSFLDAACSHDRELRAEVDSLIAAYEQPEDLSSPAWQTQFSEDPEPPATIGPYQLLRELGSGGMGQVWLAEQTLPLHRLVAIKLIRPSLYHPGARARFLDERQSLALMNHPCIAKVFDAGETAAGQLYFVMEYVDGCPITDYCDRNRLPIPQRLRLLQMVCEGVQHAHLKAVIHRDLKPSNILVQEVDGKPSPRIIDFGVAKTLVPTVGEERTQTRVGSFIGTLGYMSPEQAGLSGEDIDTRTDGYSLGVILYELLAGTLPHQYKDLTWYEAVRRLREQEPPRPSVRLRDSAGAADIAAHRRTDAQALARALRGDMDLIALKAIAIDRDRRYETPSLLSADIDRFLHDEPVLAHAGSWRYLAGKYMRRHRTGIAVAACTVLLLIGFSVAQTWQLRNTRLQRDRADRIADFMTSMFRTPDPSESHGNTVTARQILDQSTQQVESGQGLDPILRQQLLQVMALTYKGLGLYGRARGLAQQVYEDRRRSLGPYDRNTLEAMTRLAEIMDFQGEATQAEALTRQAIAMQTRALGAEDALTLKSKHNLAIYLLDHAHYVEAETLERQVIPIETRTLGKHARLTFESLNTFAMTLRGQSRFAEADAIFQPLLADERRVLGPDHPEVLATMNNYANTLAEQGRRHEAEVLYRETILTDRRVLGVEHPDTADTITNLANTITGDPQRRTEAEGLYRESLAIEQRVSGPEHPYTLNAQEGLATNVMSQGRYREAEPLLRQVLATRARVQGADNTDTLQTAYHLARVLLLQKHYAEAERLMRATLERQMQVLDKDDTDTLVSGTLLARILLKEGHPEEAEKLVRKDYEAEVRLLGPQHEDTIESREYLAISLAQQGRSGEAQALDQDWIEHAKQDGNQSLLVP